MNKNNEKSKNQEQTALDVDNAEKTSPERVSGETGGPSGPEPTRYGDWEKNGRCSDF